MSDEQKATSALTLLVESCNAALHALSESVNAQDFPTSDFSVLRTDFVSLLAIIYAATTKVALSLKPSEPHHKASLVPLRDLTNNVAALVHSIRLMRLQEGATLLKEYETVTRNVISAVRSLAQTLLENDPAQSYLIRTGEVHELVDRARKSDGLSMTNCDAVRKSWSQNHESLMDGYEEIQEICKQHEGDDDDDDDDDDDEGFDDGWDELGLNSKQKLSASELDRATKVQSLVKIVTLLHARVLKEVLSPTAKKRDNTALDTLCSLSNDLLNASDDLISSMYAPHELSNIKPCFNNFWDVTKNMRSIICPPKGDSLEAKLDSVSLSSESKSDKWFITCFEQIDKTAAKILDGLEDAHDS